MIQNELWSRGVACRRNMHIVNKHCVYPSMPVSSAGVVCTEVQTCRVVSSCNKFYQRINYYDRCCQRLSIKFILTTSGASFAIRDESLDAVAEPHLCCRSRSASEALRLLCTLDKQ